MILRFNFCKQKWVKQNHSKMLILLHNIPEINKTSKDIFKQEDRLLLADVSSALDDLLEEQFVKEEQMEEDLCTLPGDWCMEHIDVGQ